MHPLKPTECTPTAVETGHPGLVGPGKNWGLGAICWGQREAVGFLTQTDSAEAPFPHSTPETAEFLGEDLLQVRAWAGWTGRQVRAGCQYRG